MVHTGTYRGTLCCPHCVGQTTCYGWQDATVKFLKFRMPENVAVIYLKIQAKRPNLRVFHQEDTNGIANSEDPNQTAPLGAV